MGFEFLVLSREFVTKYTEIECSENGVYLYRVVLEGARSAWSGSNLLKDGGFENENDNDPAWLASGEPQIDNSRLRPVQVLRQCGRRRQQACTRLSLWNRVGLLTRWDTGQGQMRTIR